MNELDLSDVTYEEIVDYIDNAILEELDKGFTYKGVIKEESITEITRLQLAKNVLENISTKIKEGEIND